LKKPLNLIKKFITYHLQKSFGIYNQKTTFPMKKAILFLLLVALLTALPDPLHLKKAIPRPAEVLQNLNFTRIVGKWGDIKLHR
jgi:hypothetical protein